MNDDNLDFLNQNNSTDLFKEIDEEKKKAEVTTDEFVSSLPDWDLPPLFEKVRRVTRE